MKTYRIHPAALTFPLASKDDFAAVKRSILERGQDFPAIVHEGMLLDGRTRQKALVQLHAEKKIPPATELKVVPFRGGSLAGFVRAANADRRHLTTGQLAMIARKLLPLFRKEAKEKQAAAARSTNRAKKRGQKSLPLPAPGRTASASERAAEAAGGKVSARSVERADFIAKNDAALAKAVFEGALTPKQAEKKIRHRQGLAQVKTYVAPKGKFNVVTTDFSWMYRDTLDGSDAVRGSPTYPPMTPLQICQFIATTLADVCDKICLLGCWVTGPISLDLETWPPVQRAIQDLGFKPLCERTWVKTEASGGDFTGLGRPVRWDTEKLVLFVRGPVVFNELGAEHGRPLQRTSFRAPIGEHSEKPAKAYGDLEYLVPYTKRLEMFARTERPGWVTSGSELAQPPASGDSAPAAARAALPTFEAPPDSDGGGASFSQPGGLGTYAPGLGKREFLEKEALESERSDKPAALVGEVLPPDPAWEYPRAEGARTEPETPAELVVERDADAPPPIDPASLAAPTDDEINF